MNNKKRTISSGDTYLSIVAIFVILCIAIGALCFGYYSSLSSTLKEESSNYLSELSRRIASGAERIITDNMAVLQTMATSVDSIDTTSFEEVRPMLKKQQEHFTFNEIMLIDNDGKMYGLDGKVVFYSMEDSVRNDILGMKKAMSTTQIINNKEYILFSVPLENTVLDENKMIALVGCYDPEYFDQVLSMSSFDEKSYSQIISLNGSMVTRPSNIYSLKAGYNVISSIQSSQIGEGYSAQKMLSDMSKNLAGHLTFSIDGMDRYLIYTPIEQNNWYLVTFVPTETVTHKSDVLLRTTLLISGLITFIFASLIAGIMFIFDNNKRKLEYMAYVDVVTGGNTLQRFTQLVTNCLDANGANQYALVYTNIEKFKVMNEQFGRQTCDSVLVLLSEKFEELLGDKEHIGRISADNFCLLMRFDHEEELVNRLAKWYDDTEKFILEQNYPWELPVLHMGIYKIQNTSMLISQMIDRAKLALREDSWTVVNKLRCAYYDDQVRRLLVREKHLEDIMFTSLESNEFLVYLQPKYRLPSEVIGGAEALVRWHREEEGMIYPNEFIPLFEKNGFVIKVDLWVFEQVCKTIRKWVNNGKTPIKISVNCSRAHFKDPYFLAPYIKIANDYNIDRSLLELELTESFVMEDSAKLTSILTTIKEAGFGCSMDDFGSGYSSLNMIQTVDVDTVKLDRIFFNKNYDPERTEAVVKSIVTMANSLNMETVAEGVEYREQVEMLKRTGLDYVQGFVFAKPMGIDKFEELAFGHEIK